jgi:hypothetical protein
LELAHGVDDEGGEQRGSVGTVEAVEGASEAVIAEEAGLPWLEAQVLGDTAGGPLREPIERATCEQEVGDKDAEGDGRGDVFGAPAVRQQVSREEGFELQTVEEVTDDGCGADFERFEGGLVDGGGHQCLSARGVKREGCYGDRRAGGKKTRRSKKILARLRTARASLARIFLLVKERGRSWEAS